MGLFSTIADLFGRKTESGRRVPSQIGLPDFQISAGRGLSDFVNKFLPLFEPGKEFGGDFVAGLSEFEKTGLDQLKGFLGSPSTSPLSQGIEKTLLDTVSGKFADPSTSPFVQSLTNLSNINLRDTIDASRARRGGRGSFFTEAALREEGDIANKSLAFLDTVVGDFINQERGRQQAAIPIAQQFDQFKRLTEPLTRISASQEFGQLPRLLEQADLESNYQDFLRKQGELGGVVNTAQNLFSTRTPFTPEFQEPDIEKDSTFGKIFRVIDAINENTDFGSVFKGGEDGQGGGFDISQLIKLLPQLLGAGV